MGVPPHLDVLGGPGDHLGEQLGVVLPAGGLRRARQARRGRHVLGGPPSPPTPSSPSSLPNHLSITSSLLTNLTHHINCLSFRIICHAVECLRRHVGTVHTMNTMLPYSATADTFSQHRINNLLLSFPLPPFCHFGSGLSSPYPFNFHHVPTWLMSAVSLNPSFVLPGSDLPARSL